MTDLEKRVEEYLGNNFCKNVCTSQENEECVNGIRIRCMSFNDKKKHLVEFATEITKELQEENRSLLESCEGATMMYKDLTKAKEIIRELISWQILSQYWEAKAKAFLKECE